jgi:hypothetical protein
MCKPRSTWSLSFPVPVSRSLQVSLLASQPTESAAGGEPCGEPAISIHSHHVSLVQWTTCLLPATRDTGLNPLGGLMWNRDSPVSVVLLHPLAYFPWWLEQASQHLLYIPESFTVASLAVASLAVAVRSPSLPSLCLSRSHLPIGPPVIPLFPSHSNPKYASWQTEKGTEM